MTTALMRAAVPLTTPGEKTLQTPEALHAHFLEILPRVETHARIFFRYLKCPGKKDDAVAETVAVAWKWFLRATERGKDVREFAAALASLAARHVRSGRRLCGQEKARDVMSAVAQRSKGFVTHPLIDGGDGFGGILDDALRDNTQTPIPDQVHFRVEVPPWLASLGDRKRRIAEDLMVGGATGEVASRHGMTPGRVSQIRTELMGDWVRYQGVCAVA